MKNVPEKIYLQVGSDCDHDVDFNKLVGVTWNKERINKNDAEYVRADLLKWNKVEDCLPEKTKIPYQVIGKTLPHKIIGTKELKNTYVTVWVGKTEPEFKTYCERLKITEWKPIN